MEIIEFHEQAISTRKQFELIDITSIVERFIKKKKVKKGQITITTQHTTTAITVNEKESRLFKDIKYHLDCLVPLDKKYLHDDIHKRRNCPPDEPKNAHAHLRALLMGASETIPIVMGKLHLGKWQRIIFVELDGPRKRNVSFSLIGR